MRKHRGPARWRAALGTAAWLAGLASARAASACASCFTATEGTREAYYGTTILLIALPAVLVVSIVVWLRRAARRAELELGASQGSARQRRDAAVTG